MVGGSNLGRFLMYSVLTLLALFVLASYVVLEHGGGGIAAPGEPIGVLDVTIHDLTLDPEYYKSRQVRASGTLGYNDDTGRWELFDAPGGANYTVAIRNYDEATLQRFDGELIEVTGVFGESSDIGVFIEPSRLSPVEDPQ